MTYSDDMKKMQQDAIRRVREMQARAKKNIENTRTSMPIENNQENIKNRNQKGNHNSHQYSNQSKNRNKPPIHQEKPKEECNIPPINSNDKKESTPKGSGINHIIDALLKDEEKTLILILILLLMSEKDNTELLLALIYLIS